MTLAVWAHMCLAKIAATRCAKAPIHSQQVPNVCVQTDAVQCPHYECRPTCRTAAVCICLDTFFSFPAFVVHKVSSPATQHKHVPAVKKKEKKKQQPHATRARGSTMSYGGAAITNTILLFTGCRVGAAIALETN